MRASNNNGKVYDDGSPVSYSVDWNEDEPGKYNLEEIGDIDQDGKGRLLAVFATEEDALTAQTALCEYQEHRVESAGEIKAQLRAELDKLQEETLRSIMHGFDEGRNAAIDGAAKMAYGMGRPDIRDAINGLAAPPRGQA